MWELVRAKKQRAKQTPAWQTIPHHDHPAPPISPKVEDSTPDDASPRPHGPPGADDNGSS